MDSREKKEEAIGIFDSGVGGISVLKELQKEMPYENFKSKNPLAAKIAANARKFDVQTLQNEDLVNLLLNEKKIEISGEQKEAVERVFTGLMKIEESVQLSG